MFSTGVRARTNHLGLSHTQVSQAIRVDGFGPGAPCSLAQHPEARDAPWAPSQQLDCSPGAGGGGELYKAPNVT